MNVNQESTEENIEPIIPLLRTGVASESEETKKDTTTSPFGSIFVLINAALGAGLLAFPYAFWSSGGVAIALLLEAVLIVFVTGSLLILAKGIDETNASSFEGLVSALCGRGLGIVCQVSIALYCFGTTIAFLVIIGDQLVDVSSAFNVSHHGPLSDQWYFDRKFSISILSLIFIFPFLMLKNIGSLSYTSILGVIGCVYITIIVCVKYFLLHDDDHYFTCYRPQPLSSDCHRSWMDVFNAIPVICFGYQCHISSVPIYAGLRKRSLRRYAVVLAIGMAVCVGVYSLTGTFGYLTFNHQSSCINADILRNYCPKDIPVNIARGMLTLCIITSYPILHFVGRSAFDSSLVEGLLASNIVTQETLDNWQLTRLRAEAVVWYVCSLGLAIFIPDIVKVIQPLGGLAAAFIFIFPGICLLRILKKLSTRHYTTLSNILLYTGACLCIVVGFYIFGDAVVYSLMTNVGAIQP